MHKSLPVKTPPAHCKARIEVSGCLFYDDSQNIYGRKTLRKHADQRALADIEGERNERLPRLVESYLRLVKGTAEMLEVIHEQAGKPTTSTRSA